jgi:hypothetical protein
MRLLGIHFRTLYITLAVMMALGGCSSEDTATRFYEETDPFVRQVFDAVVARDLDAYLALCVQPDDVGVDGNPLMTRQERGGLSWRAYYETHFQRLLSEIEQVGGVETLQWVGPGPALGYMSEENEFVSNLYAEVTVGPNAMRMVLEIGPTFRSEGRGRLIDEDSAVYLKTWEYYEANVL